MADEENENTEESQDEANLPVEDEEFVKPRVTYVTNLQWSLMFGLLAGLGYFYILWPMIADKEQVLAAPDRYLTDAEKRFREAHSTHQFPRITRLNAYRDVIWNYRTAVEAGGELNAEEYFRWALAGYETALANHPGSRQALLEPIQNLKKALTQLTSEEDKSFVAKVRYLLGKCYIETDRIQDELLRSQGVKEVPPASTSRAIEQLVYLRDIKIAYDNMQRTLDRRGDLVSTVPPIELSASPYRLQLAELNRIELLLGRAYYNKSEYLKASEVLNRYLESTRRESLNRSLSDRKIEPELKARFEALSLLSKIHFENSRRRFIELKKIKANKRTPLNKIKLEEALWKTSLRRASRRLEELFDPNYMVFGLSEQKRMLAEVSYFLGNHERVKALAKDYENDDRSKLRAMDLWELRSMIALNPKEPVGRVLNEIAGENIRREVRLAAYVVLGNWQNSQGEIDLALGRLISSKLKLNTAQAIGAYFKATIEFDEEEFDRNPYIEKMSLIEAVFTRASKARDSSDEETAIKLYRFLLDNYTVPQAVTIHHIAHLKRHLASEQPIKDGKLSEFARKMYMQSSEGFLRVLDPEIPFDKSAVDDALFEAAESYFQGQYYSNAYENYQAFIKEMGRKDGRLTKALHKMGVAALHRRRPTRFDDAKKAFIANITRNLRPVDDNSKMATRASMQLTAEEIEAKNKITQTEKQKELLEDFELSKVLRDINSAPRDIWSYQSYLELGKVYYAQHKYGKAKRVYQSIMKDKRFQPSSTIWRKAAYQLARLSFDAASESRKKMKPWPEAIARLEEVLLRFDLDHFSEMFFQGDGENVKIEDSELYKEIKADNSEVKFLLAKAYLMSNKKPDNNELKQSIKHAKELLEDKKKFVLDDYKRQLTQALLADALFDEKEYKEALEYYRRAHDWNIDKMNSFERPFYSINMADCLAQLGKKDKAIDLLKRTRWEFKELYNDPRSILSDKQGKDMNSQDWVSFVDEKIKLLERG